MNEWTKLSIEYANQRSYLDDLFRVYPTTPEGISKMFRNWVNKKCLGIQPVNLQEFTKNNENAILDASDAVMMGFAKQELNYNHPKGLDFVARFNGKYVIGEAKFLTDFGGHQNAQFNDAINVKAIKIAILDGIVYNKPALITEKYNNCNIMSVLVLREFLYHL